MNPLHQFRRIDFDHFKAFSKFSIHLRSFNILVGPNNAGKSTILAAFRILASGIRKASARKAEVVTGPNGETLGHRVDLKAISVAEENIFYNYDDTHSASVRFRLSNGNSLLLYFPPQSHHCNLILDSSKRCDSPGTFKTHFNCPIGFVPILGPVEHNEQLFEKDAARLALFSYHAARNFRNIWHHYSDDFDEFRELLRRTWPGMDIERPEIHHMDGKPRLYVFCPEERIPREICWSGFGFQVWCQMLTHLVKGKNASLFLIDEPDIYLHSDLQRQLLGLLRSLGPDILVATHSTEIITEAEPDEIVIINKSYKSAKRLSSPAELFEVFSALGSNLNPTLTQLAKTRRVLFVEGKDFQVLARFASKLRNTTVGTRSTFAVIPVEGFNPQRVKSMKAGIEATLGGRILAGTILDRDYRSDAECDAIREDCRSFCDFIVIHGRKEIENFLLVPEAIDRAAAKRAAVLAERSGEQKSYTGRATSMLTKYSDERKEYVLAQTLAARRRFERSRNARDHEATMNEAGLRAFNDAWKVEALRLAMLPGKETLSHINHNLQRECGVSLTPAAIIESMKLDEVPIEVQGLISEIDRFAKKACPN